MINEVKIYSRRNMERFVETNGSYFPYQKRPWYLISIHIDEDVFLTDENKKAMIELGCRDSISLSFWDVTEKQVKEFISDDLRVNAMLFNDDLAETIIGFIASCDQDSEKDDEENGVLVVHCDAGISRSGACGVFAVDFLRLDYQKFIQDNNYIHPNPHVLRVLRRKAGLTPATMDDLKIRDDKTIKGYNTIAQKKIDNGEIFS